MIRVVVIMLAAANLLYLAWASWVSDNRSQLTAVAAAPPRAPAPPPPPGPPLCATVGPFSDELAALQARQKLEAAGWGVVPRTETHEAVSGWWVYVAGASAAEQTRTLNAIRRAGITDAFAMPEDAEYRVSVGIFSEEARAEDRAARVQRLQLDAHVTERRTQQTETWFDVPGVARETLGDGRLAATGLPLEKLRVEVCPPPPAAVSTTTDAAAPDAGASGPPPGTPAAAAP